MIKEMLVNKWTSAMAGLINNLIAGKLPTDRLLSELKDSYATAWQGGASYAYGLKFSEELPKEEGWYWYEANEQTHRNIPSVRQSMAIRTKVAVILRVIYEPQYSRFIVRFPAEQFDIRTLAGKWAGPIPTPEYL